jgi:phage tail sheath gpL-like
MSPEDLQLYGEQFIATVLSESGQYEIVERAAQSDGSFLLVWRATVEHRGAPVAARGLTYAEQRGDKLSVLTLITEDDQLQALWDAGLGTVINSYKIDPAQPLLP